MTSTILFRLNDERGGMYIKMEGVKQTSDQYINSYALRVNFSIEGKCSLDQVYDVDGPVSAFLKAWEIYRQIPT